MTPETPYETRFFTVWIDNKGEIMSVDTGKIAAIETSDAIAYAKEVWQSGKTSGFYQTYRYKTVVEDNNNMIIFIDRSRELISFRILVITSISVSTVGLIGIFLLVVIFSKMVFRPVAASYEKQKRFITDASHELKTPLSIISADVEVLELEDGEDSWTRSIRNQVARMNSLVEQMVTLSRMDEEKDTKEFQPFLISKVLKETAELFEPVLQTKDLLLSVTVEKEFTYCGDEKLIRQMVSLLLDNAVKYSSPKGEIRICLKAKGKRMLLSVWNTVDDIEKGNQDILFERFYRRDASRNSETGGSGIGLSIVKSIVETHKGKISARSEDGKSIEFVERLHRIYIG